MEKEKWTTDLRRKLSNHEIAPPEGLWEDIEAALTKPSARQQRLRRWAAAAAVTLILAGGGTTFMWLANTPQAHQQAQNVHQTTPDKHLSAPNAQTPAQEPQRPTLLAQNLTPDAQRPATKVQPAALNTDVATSPEKTDDREPLPEPTASPEQSHDKSTESQTPQPANHQRPTTSGTQYHAPSAKRSSSAGRLSAALLATNVATANGMGSTSLQPSGPESPSMQNSPWFAESNVLNHYTASNNMAALNSYKETAEHHRPLQVGLSLRYAIDERWSVETGLIYSHVTSDFRRKMLAMESETHQVLQYVGIPLNVIYQLWSHGRLSVYGSGGAEADLNVKATQETNQLTSNMDKDRLQWSVNAAVGAQYQLVPHMSLYLQPGVQYYIDNGSHVENIFKEQPLGLNLQFGVRIDWNR